MIEAPPDMFFSIWRQSTQSNSGRGAGLLGGNASLRSNVRLGTFEAVGKEPTVWNASIVTFHKRLERKGKKAGRSCVTTAAYMARGEMQSAAAIKKKTVLWKKRQIGIDMRVTAA